MSKSKEIRKIKIALLGNPNSGKSSLFNILTGLNQKISNYPGVTVDKKTGVVEIQNGHELHIMDFPGIYSLYPNSSDEKIVVDILTNPANDDFPDIILFVASGTELEKHFLLAVQLRELNLPMLVCLTMSDIADRKGVQYDLEALSTFLDVPVIEVSTKKGDSLERLKGEIVLLTEQDQVSPWSSGYQPSGEELRVTTIVKEELGGVNEYQNLLRAHHYDWLQHLSAAQRIRLHARLEEENFQSTRHQIDETLKRFDQFTPIIQGALLSSNGRKISVSERVDRIITHKWLGPAIFFVLMFLVFQAIYSWAEWPMTIIENLFAGLTTWIQVNLPAGWLTDLISDGIVAGLGGIMVFIPQIAILFFLISVLEEIGYMSRAVYMFDSVMQKFGLNGRSIVALISGGACAIPAIMSTRTIANWKERLTTIMVTPLISCSARIPVYTVLIGFAVPKQTVATYFNTQGLAFMGLYLLGIIAALGSALVFKYILKSKEYSLLMIELPHYKPPMFRNVYLTVREKVGTFIVEAGKIILLVSIILWFLASYGPTQSMEEATRGAQAQAVEQGLSDNETSDVVASARLEASFAGHLGRAIEPIIEPLGFDWKMGIALITSFAAREVFVGTMATIYSVGSTEDELTIREKMSKEINPLNGQKRYDMATSISLLLFYVFALQCMSTLAITRRETNSWKWPAIQFSYMGIMAYVSSLIAYQLLS